MITPPPPQTVFLVAALSITRSLYLVTPFKRLNKHAVMGIILAYITLLFVQSTIPLWTGHIYKYYTHTVCDWFAEETLAEYPRAKKIYSQLYAFENYFPIFPIIISCCVTLASLRRSDNRAINAANRSITNTIIFFTLLFVLCNLPPTFIYVTTTIRINHGINVIDTTWDNTYYYFFQFYNVYYVCINSAVNPVLYMWRMPTLRRATVRLCADKSVALSRAFVSTVPIDPLARDKHSIMTMDNGTTPV